MLLLKEATKKVLVLIVLVLAGALVGEDLSIRPAAVAGQFYPADPVQLKTVVESKLSAASKIAVPGKIVGIVAPHAGYEYSAATAAAAYKQVADNNYDLVVVIAPSHRDPFRGATIFPGDAYKTPLGRSFIDKAAAQTLAAFCDAVQFSVYGHRGEHAVEVQLPFIRMLFPKAKILPIVIGGYDWDMCEKLGAAIARVLKNKNALIVASSDLYHGYSYAECKSVCGATLQAMTRLSPKNLFDGLQTAEFQACGGGPVVVMQIAAKALGADKAVLLKRTNSNDVIGRKGGYVVGYGAVALFNSDENAAGSKHRTYSPLNEDAQRELLRIARLSIEQYMKNSRIPEFKPMYDVLKERRGVFVTLNEGGQLRGCIGHHESNVPLYKLVPQMAVAAAFEDPRFQALSPVELDAIHIKVSVYLTDVYKIAGLDEFKMGVHGIIMRKGGRSATYLPEVPTEVGWTTVDEEMASLCHKAGLPSDAWKSGAEFWVYRTQVFDESLLK